MQKGEGGFKDRDLYAFCANASDGIITAHPALKGKNIREIKDKDGKALGEEMMKVATEGKVNEVSYMWPRPGADTTPVQKVSYVTKAGDQLCGVGYYKWTAEFDASPRALFRGRPGLWPVFGG